MFKSLDQIGAGHWGAMMNRGQSVLASVLSWQHTLQAVSGLMAAGALLLASPAYAGAGFSTAVVVKSVNARDIGTDAYVPGFSNPFGCTNAEWFRILNDVSNGDMMRATLLTAYATGRPVQVWVNGCASDGVATVLAVWASP